MKSIYSLVPDIYQLITSKKDGWFTPELAKTFSDEVALRLSVHLNENKGNPRLRLSKMGPQCPCALWHSINKPGLSEPLPPQAMIKFSYGHVLEAFAIMLARAAGHTVTGEQDVLDVNGIKGHRDCVVDGCVLDVKSCSAFVFQKFKEGTIRDDDSFGYLDQLDGYLCGSQSDPLVLDKDNAFILAIDKVLGNMVLYRHEFRGCDYIRERAERYKKIVSLETPPSCECEVRPLGKSGNMELGVKASYSDQKWNCFPDLRAFRYADKIKYLSDVRKMPDVPEVTELIRPRF